MLSYITGGKYAESLSDETARAFERLWTGKADEGVLKGKLRSGITGGSLMEVVSLADEAQEHAEERKGLDFRNYETVEAYLKKTVQGKDIVNKATGITAKISCTGINKSLSNKAVSKSFANGFSRALHYEAVANIAKIFEESVRTSIGKDKKGSPDIKAIMRFEVPVVFQDGHGSETKANAYLTVKESVQQGSRIYSLELKELKKEAQYRFLWDEAKAQGTIGVEKKGMRPQTCKHPN